jgi:uncharacterized cupredoxin-like copper-binding protein
MSAIRAVALMHQHSPGPGPDRPSRRSSSPSSSPSRKLRRRASLAAAPVLLALAVTLPACGSDGDSTTTKADDKAAVTTTTEAEPTTTVADDGSITVTAVDFAYEDLPETVPAGTKFRLVNDAPAELHEFVAFRLPDDEERSAEELIALPQDELEAAFGGPPATVLLAKPGEPQIEAVGDGTLTEPGRYLVACSIPVGADPDELLESEGPPPAGGVPHFHKGMYAEITVE